MLLVGYGCTHTQVHNLPIPPLEFTSLFANKGVCMYALVSGGSGSVTELVSPNKCTQQACSVFRECEFPVCECTHVLTHMSVVC